MTENQAHWREHPLDGKLLRFDRTTGINQLIESTRTQTLVQRAPRFLHVALTNDCNKSCTFCYRPLDAPSLWCFDELIALAHWAAEWGVLEMTFGGGEPLVFPRFSELLRAIWERTPICPSFTTNGLLLSSEFLGAIQGFYGQLQLSVYDDEQPLEKIELLVREKARFGLNVLVTPRRLRTLEVDLLRWYGLGVRDVLLLSYKGDDASMHLSQRQDAQLTASVQRLRTRFGPGLSFKVDVCWRQRLAGLPQLLDRDDCDAGDAFLSISSDKRAGPCSFHHERVAFANLDDIPAIYQRFRQERSAAHQRGCAR
ncbi:MAG: radical SAM protein [Deltaproteobacteria bacterium]|nr:radical SAM protein [Deltaproteobacteria bacterium]